VKKEKPSELRHPASTNEVVPKPSIKGKEKEIQSQASVPTVHSKAKKLPAIQATPINEKKCKELLKALLKIPEAGLFSRPVDPIKDGCPTYVQ
jgi:transcription initiation factor TFIID subunit 2